MRCVDRDSPATRFRRGIPRCSSRGPSARSWNSSSTSGAEPFDVRGPRQRPRHTRATCRPRSGGPCGRAMRISVRLSAPTAGARSVHSSKCIMWCRSRTAARPASRTCSCAVARTMPTRRRRGSVRCWCGSRLLNGLGLDRVERRERAMRMRMRIRAAGLASRTLRRHGAVAATHQTDTCPGAPETRGASPLALRTRQIRERSKTAACRGSQASGRRVPRSLPACGNVALQVQLAATRLWEERRRPSCAASTVTAYGRNAACRRSPFRSHSTCGRRMAIASSPISWRSEGRATSR